MKTKIPFGCIAMAAMLAISLFMPTPARADIDIDRLLAQTAKQLDNGTVITVVVSNKEKGTSVWNKITPLSYLKVLGNNESPMHLRAWKMIAEGKEVVAAIKDLKASIVSLPVTLERKNFLARTIDPAVIALEALLKNSAGHSQGQVEAIHRIAVLLNL